MATSVIKQDAIDVIKICDEEFLSLSGKVILLTGGTGFVGSSLIESVIAFNEMHPESPCILLLPTRSMDFALKRRPHFFNHRAIQWFEWNGKFLTPPIAGCDYVIHSAAPTDPEIYRESAMSAMEDIANGVSAVLDFARRESISSMLYLSSGAVYGVQANDIEFQNESSRSAPDLMHSSSCYGEAKRFAELLCRASSVPCVIARLFAFIGPYQDLNGSFAVPDFIRQGIEHKEIIIKSSGSAIRTYSYASDLVISIWKLLMNGVEGEIYNVGASSPQLSIFQVAQSIAAELGGVEVKVRKNTSSEIRSRYVPNIDKVSLIYKPKYSFEDGLRRTISSYLEGGTSR